MRIKAILTLAVLISVSSVFANNDLKRANFDSKATKTIVVTSEKIKVQLSRIRKATEIIPQNAANTNKYDAVVLNNSVETTYQPIFEPSKIKLSKNR